MRKAVYAGVAGSLVMITLIALDRESTAPVDTAAERAAKQVPSLGSGLGYAESFVAAWSEEEFNQSYTIIDFRDFIIVDQEFNQATSTWESTYYTSSSSFDIDISTTNGRDHFYVAGMDANGNVIVEEWRLKAKIGMPGVPVTKVVKKTELHRGPLTAPPAAIGVDPDKRFVLLLVGPEAGRELYSIPIGGALDQV